MNIAVIFAGGVGRRMKTNGTPKQFLCVHGKPILIFTLEKFQNNNNIDAIVISCHKDYIEHCQRLIKTFGITKVRKIVAGGDNGQSSIYNGLKAAKDISKTKKDIVLIHDGVRPLIDDELIDANIESVKANGSAITCVPAKETIVIVDDNEKIDSATNRDASRIARAPQSFYLTEILSVHEQAIKDGNTDVTDSCTLMRMYDKQLFTVLGKSENIKITTPDDFYIFKALLEAKENSIIFS